MNTVSTFAEHVEPPKHGITDESRVSEDNGKYVKNWKLDRESQLAVFKLVSSLFVILTGLAGYWIAGLL